MLIELRGREGIHVRFGCCFGLLRGNGLLYLIASTPLPGLLPQAFN